MSPQKKPAVKFMAKKVSKKTSGTTTGKTLKKAASRPLKQSPKKLSPPGKSSLMPEELIAAIGACVYLAQKGRFVSVSAFYEKLTGYAAADLIGKNFMDHVHPDDREIVEAMQKKQSRDPFEYRFIRKDNDVIWLLETSSFCAYRQSKALLAGVMDITRYKQAAESPGLKEERYSTFLQEIAENYYEADLKGNYTFVNEAMARNTGYTKEELIGMNYRQYCDTKTAKTMRKLYARLYQTGEPFTNIEVPFIIKGGVIRFAEVSGALMRDQQGLPIGFRGTSRDITERKKMEEDLRKSEERYRTILEEMDEGYFEVDLAGNFTFVNDAQCHDLGYSRKELIGMNYRQFSDAETAMNLYALCNNTFKTGKSAKGFSGQYISKDGRRHFNEVSVSLIRDAKGEPIGFRGTSRDITERKWAEDALLQSEAKYFSIIESIGDSYFETDLTGMTTFVNDKACEDLGYTREELLHMSNRDLQDEASAQETYAVFNEVYETGRPFREFQYKVNRKDGTTAIFEMAISLMRDADGKPIGFRGLSRDITERKKMENALRASEERARTLIATIPDPYIERDMQGNAVYVNEAYAALTGYSVEELRESGYNYDRYLDAKNVEIVFSTYDAVIKTGLTMKNVEVELITKSGEKRLVNLSASVVRDSHGNPTGVQAIIRDTTEKRKAEELIRQSEQSLREYSEKLELRVQERTAELEKAKVAAEAASRAKSDFMANISHEFQTPLNAVIGFTKVLQDGMFGELNAKQKEFVHYIADAGASLSRIITEILDATHVASGSIKLNFLPVSIVEALSKTSRLLAQQVEEKKQILTMDVALDADVSIEADDQKIQQVFFHILSNAVKYTADGGKIHVQVEKTRHRTSGQDGVNVAITDTGKGIKAEDIPKLFQTFGTLESPYTKPGKGIGVGLSLAKQLVELQGGDIRVESEYGRGSCFTIFLPLKQKRTGSME